MPASHRTRSLLGAATAGVLLLMSSVGLVQAKEDSEIVYANGSTWTMLAPHAITDPSPNLLESAPPFYVMAFPMSNGQPILPQGYAPQCDPCLGVPVPPYHDHLLTSAPGFGVDGTARDYEGPWHVVLMMYNPAYVLSGHFVPVTSDEDLAAAEAAGEFLPIAGLGAPNRYERGLPVVLVCPITSSHA